MMRALARVLFVFYNESMQIELTESLVSIEILKDNFIKSDNGIITSNPYSLYAQGVILAYAYDLKDKLKNKSLVLLAEHFKSLPGEKIIIPYKEIKAFICQDK